jgi:hypothetical protein
MERRPRNSKYIPLKVSGNCGLKNPSMLLTHLYQYFGLLLGCSTVGETGFPKYGGQTSMYNVHK